MDTLKKIENAGIVPVVVLEKAEDALPTAKALLSGGIDVMEITFRTDAAEASIRAVADNCPDMTVGAGTVVTVEQCRSAIAAGAKFIVLPGFSKEVVEYCLKADVAVMPGCVTPAEIMQAMACGLKVLKFFPAGIFGGLAGMKALSGPFPGIRFVPTGGVKADNLAEYAMAPYVYAVGGSWLCSKEDIAAGRYDEITRLCREARKQLLGFELAHLGINCADSEISLHICGEMNNLFGFAIKEGNSSNFASPAIEVMKSNYLGEMGHIAIRTNSVERAVAYLAEKGIGVQEKTAKYKSGRLTAIYLDREYGGFAVHLVQK